MTAIACTRYFAESALALCCAHIRVCTAVARGFLTVRQDAVEEGRHRGLRARPRVHAEPDALHPGQPLVA